MDGDAFVIVEKDRVDARRRRCTGFGNPDGNGNISYKLLAGKTLPANDYFTADSAGNISATAAAKIASGDHAGELTSGAIAWLTANYASVDENVFTMMTDDDDAQADLEVTALPYGYYFITTTTGTIVTIDSTNTTATVADKNPGTSIDKEIMVFVALSIIREK